MRFSELALEPRLVSALERQGITEPTPVQEEAIPHILAGEDVLAESATGSGKTIAFSAGLLTHTRRGGGIQAVVLTPTRELARQVADVLAGLNKQLSVTTIYGGVGYGKQEREIRVADILVGTPGRVIDHLERGTLKLDKVTQLVLDEADTMLDMGFQKPVEKIMKAMPKEKQILLFSATLSSDVQRLSQRYLKDPKRVEAGQHVDPGKLEQIGYRVERQDKFSLLAHLLKEEDSDLVMVFCNTRRTVDRVAKGLKHNGIDAQAIHGGLTQKKREKVLSTFHGGRVLVLVCTDVAARGLDIPDVSHVYNYDVPRDAKQYVHRIGRTARAGEDGIAIALVSPEDKPLVRDVEKQTGKRLETREPPRYERLRLASKKRGQQGRPAWSKGRGKRQKK